MRYWLAAGGINPDVANMKAGTMQAFCVSEPWNAQPIQENLSSSALINGELWHDHPETNLSSL